MATNVVVACRFRPPSKGEKAAGASIVATVDGSGTGVAISDPNSNAPPAKFNFDRVFDFVAQQEEVYNHTAQPLVKEIFAGYNCTVFAYGQTGSGKTHTMMGGQGEHRGIIPRLVEAIFHGIEEADAGIEFTVKLSYVEIYNERIRDLLTPRNGGSDNLKIRETPGGGVYIENVTETYVGSQDQVLQLMQQGQDNRAIASTNMNEQSSRSHSVFILTLGQLDQNTGSKKGAKLFLVDLAGSEKVGKTGAAGSVLVEAQSINKSLSALGMVINALTSNAAHIPYRDSRLTRLLSDSLGGNSKTCLVVTGSPMSSNAEETLSTLRFGSRAKLIKNMAKVNQEKSVAEYKLMLSQANTKISVQANIIELLEMDVAGLLECVQAVDPDNLPMPIPALLSRDADAVAAMQQSQAENGAAEPKPAAVATTAAAAAPAAPAPAPAPSTVSSPPPPAAAASTSTSTPATRAPIRRLPAQDDSDDESPPTSPDLTPTSSPQAKPAPSPPVVTMGLPSLEAMSLGPAAAANGAQPQAPPAPAEVALAAPLSSPATRKLSAAAPPGHSLAELMLANSDLSAQLAALRTAHTALTHNLEDKDTEMREAAEAFDKEKAKFAAEIEAIRAQQRAAEERAQKAAESDAEFQQLKQKLEYDRKEHALSLSQAEVAKTELSEEVARLTSRIGMMEAKMAAQAKAYESVMDSVKQENAALQAGQAQAQAAAAAAAAAAQAAAPASAPSSPVASERKPRPPRMSAPPTSSRAVASEDDDSLPTSSPFSLDSVSEPVYTAEEHSQIEQLSRGLKRKCDQYIQLMMTHQAQAERVESLELALEDSNARLKDHMAASARKIKELDEKLLAAENLCAKFLESGRYWRQERNQKKSAAGSKIAVPLMGGGAVRRADGSAASVGGNYGAASGSLSPAPPSGLAASAGSGGAVRTGSSASRLSGGFASSMAKFF